VLDLDKEIRVKADALDYTMGEVLSVKGEDGRWRPVAFISKSLNDTERNYEIHDKEMLAVIRCLEVWRYFLVRNGHPSNSGRRIPTLSQSRQRELVRVTAGFEYTTYIYSTWSVHYFPMVIM